MVLLKCNFMYRYKTPCCIYDLKLIITQGFIPVLKNSNLCRKNAYYCALSFMCTGYTLQQSADLQLTRKNIRIITKPQYLMNHQVTPKFRGFYTILLN